MEEEIELRQYWEVLRKRWAIVLILPIIAHSPAESLVII